MDGISEHAKTHDGLDTLMEVRKMTICQVSKLYVYVVGFEKFFMLILGSWMQIDSLRTCLA